MKQDSFWAIRRLSLVFKQAWRRDVNHIGPMAILMPHQVKNTICKYTCYVHNRSVWLSSDPIFNLTHSQRIIWECFRKKYSRTCYEQPLLWAANTKRHFVYKWTSYWQPHALKGHFSCVSRVAAHSRFYCKTKSLHHLITTIESTKITNLATRPKKIYLWTNILG